MICSLILETFHSHGFCVPTVILFSFCFICCSSLLTSAEFFSFSTQPVNAGGPWIWFWALFSVHSVSLSDFIWPHKLKSRVYADESKMSFFGPDISPSSRCLVHNLPSIHLQSLSRLQRKTFNFYSFSPSLVHLN